jgi:hypothetical protein
VSRLWQSVLQTPVSQARNVSLDELLQAFDDPTRDILPTSWGNISKEEVVQTVGEAYRRNGPVFALTYARMQILSQARFQWTRATDGTPTDLFGSADLGVLEQPWFGARTSSLISRCETFNTTAGNAFVRRVRRNGQPDRLVLLRPQWTTILLGSQEDADNPWEAADVEVAGYAYRPNGDAARTQVFDRTEVAHYMPVPDPAANFRGMSWVTPALTTVKADDASEVHRFKFFENAATPNLAIKFDPTVKVEESRRSRSSSRLEHKGAFNAYKTLYLGGGADPVTIGKDFQQMSFAAVQAKGETRLASNAGVPSSWVGFSEGLQGSALNDGNYTAARRRFGDGTIQHLWEAMATAFEVIVDKPTSRSNEKPARLTIDPRSIPFLREDIGDAAAAKAQDATTITTLVREGFTPESAVLAVKTGDWSQLKHSGLVSVQLQKPGATDTAPTTTGGTDA